MTSSIHLMPVTKLVRGSILGGAASFDYLIKMEEHQFHTISDGQPQQLHHYQLNYHAPVTNFHCHPIDHNHRLQHLQGQPVARTPSTGATAPSSTTGDELHAPADQRPASGEPSALAHGSSDRAGRERAEDYQDYANHHQHSASAGASPASALEASQRSNAFYPQQQQQQNQNQESPFYEQQQQQQQQGAYDHFAHWQAAAVVQPAAPLHPHHHHHHQHQLHQYQHHHHHQQAQHAAYIQHHNHHHHHQQQFLGQPYQHQHQFNQQHQLQQQQQHQQEQGEPGEQNQLKNGYYAASRHHQHQQQHQFALAGGAPGAEGDPEVAHATQAAGAQQRAGAAFSASPNGEQLVEHAPHYHWQGAGAVAAQKEPPAQPGAEWPRWRPRTSFAPPSGEQVDWWPQAGAQPAASLQPSQQQQQQQHLQQFQQQQQRQEQRQLADFRPPGSDAARRGDEPAAGAAVESVGARAGPAPGGPVGAPVAPAARPPSGLCTSSSGGGPPHDARPAAGRGGGGEQQQQRKQHAAGRRPQAALSNGEMGALAGAATKRASSTTTSSGRAAKRAACSKTSGRLVRGPNGLVARRKNATRETTAMLKEWLDEHGANPYPTKGEKIMLSIITKMSLTQVSTWFANARRRMKKENKAHAWASFNGSVSTGGGGGQSSGSAPRPPAGEPGASSAFRQLLSRSQLAARQAAASCRPAPAAACAPSDQRVASTSEARRASRPPAQVADVDSNQEEQAQISTTSSAATGASWAEGARRD